MSDIKLFADDTTLFYSAPSHIETHRVLEEDLKQLDSWAKKWYVKFNLNKSKVLAINCTSQNLPNLTFNCEVLEEVTSYKYLGLTLNKPFPGANISIIFVSKRKINFSLLKLSKTISKTAFFKPYTCYIRSVLEYGS